MATLFGNSLTNACSRTSNHAVRIRWYIPVVHWPRGCSPLMRGDGADASRRVIALRIPIRFLSGASRLAIKRLQRTSVPASKLACPSAADPQRVSVIFIRHLFSLMRYHRQIVRYEARGNEAFHMVTTESSLLWMFTLFRHLNRKRTMPCLSSIKAT